MTYPEINILIEKAKEKADGVYSYKGNLYAVENNRFIAYVSPQGEMFERRNMFVMKMSSTKEFKKLIKNYLKGQKENV